MRMKKNLGVLFITKEQREGAQKKTKPEGGRLSRRYRVLRILHI